MSYEDDLREQLRQQEEEAARRAMTPKPDPLESDARAELRQAKNREESGVTEQSPIAQAETEKLRTSHHEMKSQRSPRDRDLIDAIGRKVVFHFRYRQAPRVAGKLITIDWDKASIKVETPANSLSTFIWLQMSDIIRWELWQE